MISKEEKLKALNNMLEESYGITRVHRVHDDNRIGVLSEIIYDIEHDDIKLGDKQWLEVVVEDIKNTCNDFENPAIPLGAGIAIGAIIKHIR